MNRSWPLQLAQPVVDPDPRPVVGVPQDHAAALQYRSLQRRAEGIIDGETLGQVDAGLDEQRLYRPDSAGEPGEDGRAGFTAGHGARLDVRPWQPRVQENGSEMHPEIRRDLVSQEKLTEH